MIDKKEMRVIHAILLCDKCKSEMKVVGKNLTSPPTFVFECHCGNKQTESRPYPIVEYKEYKELPLRYVSKMLRGAVQKVLQFQIDGVWADVPEKDGEMEHGKS